MVLGGAIAAGWQSPLRSEPADVFQPHLERIQATLPPNFRMRLPTQILLGGPADKDFIDGLTVRVFALGDMPGMAVGLYTCADAHQFCLVGRFAVMSPQSPEARHLFRQHRWRGAPITLTRGIRGYYWAGDRQWPRSLFSSVMWAQDGLFYRVHFAAPERQNILYMALLMAQSAPLASQNPVFRDRPMTADR